MNDDRFYSGWSSTFESIDEEIMKLIFIIREEEKLVHKEYVLEKLEKLLLRYPIILHPTLEKKVQVNHPSLKERAWTVRIKGNWLIRELMQKLDERDTYTPMDAPLVRSNCDLPLNREETLSVSSLKTSSNNPEVDYSSWRRLYKRLSQQFFNRAIHLSPKGKGFLAIRRIKLAKSYLKKT